jgi:hypothetical protein
MARKAFAFAFGLALFLPVISIGTAVGADQPSVSSEIREKLAKNYPNQKIVNWCSGNFAGKATDAIAVLRNQAKKQFLVVWVMSGDIQELDTVAQTDSSSEFELQCLNPKDAKELQDTLQHSEGINSSVEIPKGSGAVCYFTDATVANCWSLNRASGRLVRVGAWET